MIEILKEYPIKIPQPTRDEMMKMLNNAIKSVNIDCADGFKSLFVTNNFDGSEDFLVSDKIYNLVSTEMVKLREDLLNSVPPKNVKELMKTITPPKGGGDENNQLMKDMTFLMGMIMMKPL